MSVSEKIVHLMKSLISWCTIQIYNFRAQTYLGKYCVVCAGVCLRWLRIYKNNNDKTLEDIKIKY